MAQLDPWQVGPDDGAIHESELVIIGAGLSGLYAALCLPDLPVTILSAKPLGFGASSNWAQGGIAAAVSEGDSAGQHAADTIKAGAGLVDEAIAHLVADEGAEAITDLLSYGVPFDQDLDGKLKLSREAAHSKRRVVRVKGDGAGAAIMAALITHVRARDNIRLIENVDVVSFKTKNNAIEGVYLSPNSDSDLNEKVFLATRRVLMATGGAGQLYAVTTNPAPATGSGIAMAARAGAVIKDAEFIQFHPTALDAGFDPAPLLTEALRGEGAVLIDNQGARFMDGVHPDGELAPRDIVARAVYRQSIEGHGAFLDCRQAIGDSFPKRFPTVYSSTQKANINPITEPIPVTPAAHYTMGGVACDDRGRTSIKGLWVVGEVAATGLHGANRLASNSLLEAVVFAKRSSADVSQLSQSKPPTIRHQPLRTLSTTEKLDHTDCGVLNRSHVQTLRTLMYEHVGVERDHDGLVYAMEQLEKLSLLLSNCADGRNFIVTARFIIAAALMRKESRGAHYRIDYPMPKGARGIHSCLSLQQVDSYFSQTLHSKVHV